ncbi:MAG TPA: LysE family transporter [Candidatus Binataceae bacterium]|nr:LysE family transporter [Candidatus Binataceae bacterium]
MRNLDGLRHLRDHAIPDARPGRTVRAVAGVGALSSIWANLGVLAGNTIYFILSATGLGAILLASYDLFSAIRWIGAVYLISLGISAFIGKSQLLSVATPTRNRPSLRESFSTG